MTQEELYWYEKRLRMKADAKEREIREHYNFLLNRPIPQWMRESESKMREIEWEKNRLRRICNQEIEYARLEILEPILDYEEKKRFNSLRDARERKKQEEEKKRQEEERKRQEEERKRQEEERKRLRQREQEQIKRQERIQEEIKPIEEDLLNGKSISVDLWKKAALYTKKQQIIDVCKNSSHKQVLQSLLKNESVKIIDINYTKNRLSEILQNESAQRAREAQERREKKERQERRNSCLKLIVFILIILASIFMFFIMFV